MGNQKKVNRIQIFRNEWSKASFLVQVFLVLDNGNKGNCAKKEQLEESRGGAYIFIKNKKRKEKLFSREKQTPLISINHYNLN